MKVQCPKCNTNYNIDPSKVPDSPDKGITVTCPKCKQKFPLEIKKEESSEKSKEKKDIIIPCPDCGHVNISVKKCSGCGKIFSDEELQNLKITIGG